MVRQQSLELRIVVRIHDGELMSCEKSKVRAEDLGGEDEKENPNRETRSCDKHDHAMRSLAHQPNHSKHWGIDLELPSATYREIKLPT